MLLALVVGSTDVVVLSVVGIISSVGSGSVVASMLEGVSSVICGSMISRLVACLLVVLVICLVVCVGFGVDFLGAVCDDPLHRILSPQHSMIQ